jgi:hypothetical protein
MAIKLKKGFLTLLIISLPIVSACVRIESRQGKVIDAETKKPLKHVAVVMRVIGYCPGIGTGGDSKDIAIKETFTDEEGHYRFARKLYIMPFYHFYDDTVFHFIKPGYFERLESRRHPSVGDLPNKDNNTELFRMTHYLDFDYYRGRFLPEPDFPKWKSEYYQDAIIQNRKQETIPEGEKSVFETFEGKAFTRIYSTENRGDSISYVPASISRSIYYVYDGIGKKWLTVDSLGKIVQPHISSLPQWHSLSSGTWLSPIFANKDQIFYTVRTENAFEVRYINPFKGDISEISGDVNNFFTIEDKGRLLCYYADRNMRKCYKVEDFFNSTDVLLGNDSRFGYISGCCVVTRIGNCWHIHNFTSFPKSGGGIRESIVELGGFPSDKEITAFAVGGGSLYIAFKNEGIRKYDFIAYSGKISLKENKTFLKNSMEAKYSDVCYLCTGWGVHALAVRGPAVYAVAGNDRIYRFSEEGIPDYKIKIEVE